ncbi:MAG: hypothetical protein MJ230_00720 [bacterium]|nr:hypothetical protein [bacterium]
MITSKYLKFNTIYPGVKCIELFTTLSRKRVHAYQVKLNNNIISLFDYRINKVQQWIIDWISNGSNESTSKNSSRRLVKKTVRVDSDMHNSLVSCTNVDKTEISRIISNAVMGEISNNEIILIGSCDFTYRVTVYFTPQQYAHIKQIVEELKHRQLGVTFSSLVRSILYKTLKHVKEIKGELKNEQC